MPHLIILPNFTCFICKEWWCFCCFICYCYWCTSWNYKRQSYFIASVSNAITKINFIKTTRKKIKKHNNIVLVARIKLNSIGNIISKALTDNEIAHEEFTRNINEERRKIYRNDIRNVCKILETMESQRGDIERGKLGAEEILKTSIKPYKKWICIATNVMSI